MKLSPIIEDAVERVLEKTGFLNSVYEHKGPINEIEACIEGMREYLRIEFCKIAKASSLDANIAQHCSAYTVSH
jgi:hypothetical protein